MKKLFPILLLAASLVSLAGCEKEEIDPIDKLGITKIYFNGKMQKKNYNWDDEWNLNGLTVKAITSDGSTIELPKEKYTITFSKKAPKNYTTQLKITAKYTFKDAQKSDSVTYSDIKVADEVYDNDKEVAAYYSDCNLTKTGSNLLAELHTHSFKKHTYFTKYGETQSLLAKADRDRDFEAPDLIPNKHKIEMFYTGAESTYNIGSREHIWACADSAGLWPHGAVDESDYIGGGSDLYHIRPCNSQVNTVRGDAPYIEFDNPPSPIIESQIREVGDGGPNKLKAYGGDSKGEYSQLVEPADAFKGDIARIVAYLFMHYKNIGTTPSKYKSMVGSLDLTRVIGYSSDKECKAILKKWNALDPVSEVETRRNHTVQQIQGNRNPFVDHPELIDKAF